MDFAEFSSIDWRIRLQKSTCSKCALREVSVCAKNCAHFEHVDFGVASAGSSY